MKYTKLAISACGIALASGQGLYNMSNLYGLDEETSPLQYTLGLHYGYDDNVNPIGTDCGVEEQGSSYLSANLKAGISHNESNYSISAWGQVGVIHYLDDNIAIIDDTNLTFGGGLNLSYRINDRIRFNSRNYINYGFEPDYERGIAADRRSELYTAYSSNNDIGVRWSERFATVHGIGISGADYGNGNDYSTTTFYNQARYRISPRTVLTASYNFVDGENSDGHVISGGIEHTVSDRTGFSLRGGVSSYDYDGGGSRTAPYVNASLRHRVNEQLSLTGYINYNQDDHLNTIATACDPANLGGLLYTRFESRESLRLGLRANYTLSEKVSLFGGVSLVSSEYENGSILTAAGGDPNGPSDASALIYNLNAGFRYGITNNVSLVGSYNFSDSSSDEAQPFEYTRNRYSLGVQATF